ncbi:4Fe-4S ferredoxin [Candidatus Woesearchaeota archaeon CG10_big_fil_rev_8_21_14_0_10_44_13]|nr:MAG: 4Fe-4S ferredoxin [Candidatus Woesearchaeota archaeon CG10_big_fil_rev_8_21_14_0_10_44_13]
MPSGQRTPPKTHGKAVQRTQKKRKIIRIDEKKCNGCGFCMPNCPEGALRIIDGKARLISDIFCDGLGACIGHCPQGAIRIVERDAEPYNERKVMANIIKQGKNVIKAHLEHLREHGETGYLNSALAFLKEKKIKNPLEEKEGHEKETGKGAIKAAKDCPSGDHSQFSQIRICPGSAEMDLRDKSRSSNQSNAGLKDEMSNRQVKSGHYAQKQESMLRQWPVQLSLVSPNASFFNDAHLLVSADCVPFANPNFHSELLKGRSLVIGCPKLDDVEHYVGKLTEIIRNNRIKSITVAIMEVPCCYGLYSAVEQAVGNSGKKVPFEQKIVSVSGSMDGS